MAIGITFFLPYDANAQRRSSQLEDVNIERGQHRRGDQRTQTDSSSDTSTFDASVSCIDCSGDDGGGAFPGIDYTTYLFRPFFRPASGTYLFTRDHAEAINAVNNLGYQCTTGAGGVYGLASYIFPQQTTGTIPLYRYSQAGFLFFWTTDPVEGANAAQYGYTNYDGVAGFVYPSSDQSSIPVYRYRFISGSNGYYYSFENLGADGGTYYTNGYPNGGNGFVIKDGTAWHSPTQAEVVARGVSTSYIPPCP